MDFCTIDFETATYSRNSACEMGICKVENSKIVGKKTWLIKPPTYPIFFDANINVHGITPNDVKNAPTFDEIWHEAEAYIYGHFLLAHNASFDAAVLRQTMEHYGYFIPKIKYYCSIHLAKKAWKGLPSYGLGALASANKIQFNHHRAGDDAEVCAKIALLAFDALQITKNDQFLFSEDFNIKKL